MFPVISSKTYYNLYIWIEELEENINKITSEKEASEQQSSDVVLQENKNCKHFTTRIKVIIIHAIRERLTYKFTRK